MKKNRIFNITFGILSLIVFLSCEKNSDTDDTILDVNFGQTHYHPSFFLSKESNDTLTKVLEFEFNEYAKGKNSNVYISFLEDSSNHKGKEVFINGQKLSSYYEIKSTDTPKGELKVSIVLPADDSNSWLRLIRSKKNYFNGYLRYEGGDLDRINNEDQLADNAFMSWSATQVVKMNPLKKWLSWIIIISVILLFFWIVLFRPMIFPRIKKNSLIIHAPFYKKINLKGAVQLTLTNKNIPSQSYMSRVFKGKEIVYVNSFFTDPIVITPHNRKSVRVKLGIHYEIEPYTSIISANTTHTIKNSDTRETISVS